MGYVLMGVAASLVTVWLAVACVRVQRDQSDVVAQHSSRPWVRRALRRRGTRVLMLVLMEASGLG